MLCGPPRTFTARVHRSFSKSPAASPHLVSRFGYTELVRDMRDVLGLPADCPRAIPAGIVDRFMRWHGKAVKR